MSEVINRDLALEKSGAQVAEIDSISAKIRRSWKQIVPLVNIKLRPKEAPPDAVIYVWGALIATGRFIVDLDNPYSLVGYNPPAMTLWRHAIGIVLRSSRCLQIRCISEACKRAVGELYGDSVLKKTVVVYPRLPQEVANVVQLASGGPRYLFIGTQFLIKGGPELLLAFRQVRLRIPNARLDIVTHLPSEYKLLAEQEGVEVHRANLSRKQVWSKFMRNADVLVHPSYMESFGMVVLEAISHGMAVVANDVYAHREMIIDGENGFLLEPPVHYWKGDLAGPLFLNQYNAGAFIKKFDKEVYVTQLVDAMVAIGEDPDRLLSYRQRSCARFNQMMSFGSPGPYWV